MGRAPGQLQGDQLPMAGIVKHHDDLLDAPGPVADRCRRVLDAEAPAVPGQQHGLLDASPTRPSRVGPGPRHLPQQVEDLYDRSVAASHGTVLASQTAAYATKSGQGATKREQKRQVTTANKASVTLPSIFAAPKKTSYSSLFEAKIPRQTVASYVPQVHDLDFLVSKYGSLAGISKEVHRNGNER